MLNTQNTSFHWHTNIIFSPSLSLTHKNKEKLLSEEPQRKSWDVWTTSWMKCVLCTLSGPASDSRSHQKLWVVVFFCFFLPVRWAAEKSRTEQKLVGRILLATFNSKVPDKGLALWKRRLLQCPLGWHHLVAWVCVTSCPLEGFWSCTTLLHWWRVYGKKDERDGNRF